MKQRQSKRKLRVESLERRELLAGDLRIVEFNYNPHDAIPAYGERDSAADDFEFIELMNVGDSQLNLRNYRVEGGVLFQFSQQFLDAGERIVVTKDLKDFRSRYGFQPKVAIGNDGDGGKQGEFKGSLRNSGESLQLRSPSGSIVQRFTYYDTGEWPMRADGMGSSLEMIDVRADANDPKSWHASSEFGGSPGVEGSGMTREVVINEMLTHTDLPQIDTIELYNRTETPIDMTNWFISDSAANLYRFKIEGSQSVIGGNDYRVFDENQLGFSFRGQETDNAFLVEAASNGKPIRFVDAVSFYATQNGVSLGRWENGEGALFPMDELTFEDPNSGPLISDVSIPEIDYLPIIISEVNYHPVAPSVGSILSEDDLEFIEILNQGNFPVDLSYWQLSSAVDYRLPAGTVIGASDAIVIVGFDPANDPARAQAFLDHYEISNGIRLIGAYSDRDDPNADQLDDQSEVIKLARPEDIEQLGLGFVLVDRVTYQDSGAWPTEADGLGKSLTRSNLLGYGDDAASWTAVRPSPGTSGLKGDIDGNGRIDAADIDLLCAVANFGQNPSYDLNRDGTVNKEDVDFLIHDILNTVLGDANLDGVFDSSDLVTVFRAGEYEDRVVRNSGWASGDWNCDGEFDSSDLVAAFREGGYQAENPLQATTLTHSDLDVDDEDKKRERVKN